MSEWQRTLKRLEFAKRVLDFLIAALILGWLAMIGQAVSQAGAPTDVVATHRWVDTVLVPKFSAAWAEWALQHPEDKPPGSGSHYRTVDAGDLKRGHTMRVAFKELDGQLAQIGY